LPIFKLSGGGDLDISGILEWELRGLEPIALISRIWSMKSPMWNFHQIKPYNTIHYY
jgi:hypothetical protein